MKSELKPIRTLIMVSFALHVISLCVAIALFMLQIPLKHLMYSSVLNLETIETFTTLPLMFVILITMIFILHLSLTIGFWKNIGCEYNRLKQLRIISIVSFIFVLALFPILTSPILDMWLVSYRGIEEVFVRNIVSFAFIIRNLAFSVLLIATSMSSYYCFLKKAESKD